METTAKELYEQEVCISCKYYFYESCLRYPPADHRHDPITRKQFYSLCPLVLPRHWCGEHVSVDIAVVEERIRELEEEHSDVAV
jgi:hypothetical protein